MAQLIELSYKRIGTLAPIIKYRIVAHFLNPAVAVTPALKVYRLRPALQDRARRDQGSGSGMQTRCLPVRTRSAPARAGGVRTVGVAGPVLCWQSGGDEDCARRDQGSGSGMQTRCLPVRTRSAPARAGGVRTVGVAGPVLCWQSGGTKIARAATKGAGVGCRLAVCP